MTKPATAPIPEDETRKKWAELRRHFFNTRAEADDVDFEMWLAERIAQLEQRNAELERRLRPFLDAVKRDCDYLDADGLVSAFITEQERLRTENAELVASEMAAKKGLQSIARGLSDCEDNLMAGGKCDVLSVIQNTFIQISGLARDIESRRKRAEGGR